MAQTSISEREAAYKRKHPKTPIILFWQLSEDGSDVPRINIENPEENDVADPVFDAYGVESVEELNQKLYRDRYASESKRQLGVMAGQNENRAFFTDEELLGMVEGVSDRLAEGLIEWFTDIPSLCEDLRTNSFTSVYHDAQEHEWIDDLEEIDDMEMEMKEVGVWQEPENVSSSTI